MSTIRILTLALPALLLSMPMAAQTKTERAQVEWGPELDEKENGSFQFITAETEDAIYMVVSRKREYFLQRMDRTCRTIWEHPIILEVGKDEHSLQDIRVMDDQIHVFTSFFKKSEDVSTLFVRSYSTENFRPLAERRILARVTLTGNTARRSIGITMRNNRPYLRGTTRNVGNFGILGSPDGSKLLVSCDHPGTKDDQERFEVFILDGDLKELWRSDVKLPFADDQFRYESMQLDNEGTIYFLGIKYLEKVERRERKRENQATYDYHLFVLGEGEAVPEDHTLEIPGKFLQDMTIRLPDGDGDLFCAGFYGNKGSNSVRGAYFLRLDRKTKAIVHESFKEFDNEFITQYMTEKEEKKATKKADRKGEDLEMYEYDLDDIIIRDDGGAVLVGEQYHYYVTTTTTSTPNGGTTTTTTYHYVYNDIIAININAEGDIEWASKIPKRQHTTNDGGRYSSYAITIKGDKMYFVFNDSGENLMLLPGQKVKQFELKGKDALITLATIDADGHVHREALLAPDKRDAILMPKECFQMEDDRMFVYATRKKEYRYGMITFQ